MGQTANKSLRTSKSLTTTPEKRNKEFTLSLKETGVLRSNSLDISPFEIPSHRVPLAPTDRVSDGASEIVLSLSHSATPIINDSSVPSKFDSTSLCSVQVMAPFKALNAPSQSSSLMTPGSSTSMSLDPALKPSAFKSNERAAGPPGTILSCAVATTD